MIKVGKNSLLVKLINYNSSGNVDSIESYVSDNVPFEHEIEAIAYYDCYNDCEAIVYQFYEDDNYMSEVIRYMFRYHVEEEVINEYDNIECYISNATYKPYGTWLFEFVFELKSGWDRVVVNRTRLVTTEDIYLRYKSHVYSDKEFCLIFFRDLLDEVIENSNCESN